jgi:hypothetical protein
MSAEGLKIEILKHIAEFPSIFAGKKVYPYHVGVYVGYIQPLDDVSSLRVVSNINDIAWAVDELIRDKKLYSDTQEGMYYDSSVLGKAYFNLHI